MKKIKKILFVMMIAAMGMIVQSFSVNPLTTKAKASTNVYCHCTFWGTCKIGGGGKTCSSYDSGSGGSCTDQNRNCSLFNPN